MEIRDFCEKDVPEIIRVFQAAVHETACQDYSPEQCRVWAPAQVDLTAWKTRLGAQKCWGMWHGTVCAGFTTLDETGYLDMMFVSPDFARQGVAQELYHHLETTARAMGLGGIKVDASLTARPFFEKMGFRVEQQQTVSLRGVDFINFQMMKKLT